MFEKPSIFKVPTISGNGLDNAACGYFSPPCSSSFAPGCVDGYTAPPPPPPKDDSCGWTFAGVAITGVGSIAAVVALT